MSQYQKLKACQCVLGFSLISVYFKPHVSVFKILLFLFIYVFIYLQKKKEKKVSNTNNSRLTLVWFMLYSMMAERQVYALQHEG